MEENEKVDTYVNFDEAKTENENPEDDEIETESSANSSPQKGVLKKIANAPVNLIKSGVHSAASKINPFDKKINQNDTTDSGVESIRLANTVAKKTGQTIKTVDRTVKTTQRTIKTAENVVSVTGRAIIKTGRTAGKVIVTVAKATKSVVVHLTATLMNPIIIIIAGFLAMIIVMTSMIIMLMGGGVSASNSVQNAYTSAAGLGKVAEQYQNGLTFFDTATETRKSDFESKIDNLYYNYESDLTNSNLVYMERTNPPPTVIYEKSFPTDEQKSTLKSAWDMSLTISAKEAIAIAYIYLEKEKNDANHTEGGIYSVTFTQEVFDTILEKCVTYSDNVYDGQCCPDSNCTKHTENVSNPEYTNAWNKWQEAVVNYNASTEEDDLKYWGEQHDYWKGIVDSTSPTIEEVSYICEYKHELHSMGLAFFGKEDIMNALGFTDIDKQWETMTEKGFESNPDIPT